MTHKPLKILQTPVRFYPAIGGVEKYVLELSKSLVKDGHEVTVVCANEPPENHRTGIFGINIIRLPYIRKIANTNITTRLLPTLLRQDFDVIHTHIPTPWSADWSALVSLIKRKPLIVTYHNDLIKGGGFEALIAKAYNATFLRLLFRRASKIIITQSRYLGYSKHLRKYENKVVTIPLGITKPLPTKDIKRKPYQLFFLSVLDRHHEYKGLDVLIKSLVEVRKQYPEVHLIVGGKGELVTKYKKLAKSLGLSRNVEFLGYVPEDELPKLYASSAAFVLPSTNNLEGFGIVALEALTYATPVVTTDLAGSSEFIKKNDAGLIVSPSDISALTEAILTLLANPSKTAAMGARGANVVNQEFSWDKIAAQVVDIYKNKPAVSSKKELPKIIQVSAYYPPHLGGQENAVHDLATQLAVVGENVEVVTSDLGSTPGVTFESGVRVTRLKSLEKAHTAIIWDLLPWLLRHAKKDSIVHLHIGQAYTPEVVWLASKIKGFKYIAHMHIEPVQSSSAGMFLPIYKKLFLKRSIRAASVVVVLNDRHKRIIEQDYDYVRKVLIMSNGVDEPYFNVNRKINRDLKHPLRLLFVGRLSPQKNLPNLVKALAQLKEKAQLDIVGDGEDRVEIERMLQAMKLKNVMMHGKLERAQILEFYRTCDALILPSLYEAQPLVLLEAMAAKVPVIGTKVLGIEEHIKNIGILVESNPKALEKGITVFSKLSSRQVTEMTQKGFEKVSQLKWSKLVKKYIATYEKVNP